MIHSIVTSTQIRLILLTMLALGPLLGRGATAAADPTIEQHSEGACSPPIVNNAGQITISCPGIDETALHYLENQLTNQVQRLTAQLNSVADSQRTIRNLNDVADNLRQQADDWARRYRELSARLTVTPDDNEDSKQVHELIQHGELDRAEKILRVIANKEDAGVRRAAATQYDMGDLAMLRFDTADALTHYDQATRYEPDNPRYASSYAKAAYTQRRYADAERGWTAALERYRGLSAGHPGAYQGDIGRVLDNLGTLYEETSRLGEAEHAFREVLTIRRATAPGSPGLALTLNNFGRLYQDAGRFAEAEPAYKEALAVFRGLAESERDKYLPDLAATVNNLGIFYLASRRFPESEQAYDEALEIYRRLAERDPGAYRPSLASVLNNLGRVYGATNRLAEAESAYSEAIGFYRDLVTHDPGAYRPDLALALNNFGRLYERIGRPADAERYFKDARAIYRDLASHDPGVYQSNLAGVLDNLGMFYVDAKRMPDAQDALIEALSVRRKLVERNPVAIQQVKLALTLNYLGILYGNTRPADERQVDEQALAICHDLAQDSLKCPADLIDTLSWRLGGQRLSTPPAPRRQALGR